MKHILLFLLFCVTLLVTPALAQERRVTGRVTQADDDSGIPGATVQVKGSTRGTQTDANGNYSITIPPQGNVLVISFVGLAAQEITIGNQSIINVALASDSRSLNEVVVTGYGSESKRNLTGNIAKVSGKDITNVAVPSLEQAIQGRAAGVQVTALNGKLGQGIQIRVRGASSVSASNEPLYVVDGIPITSQSLSNNGAPTSPIADLNFNDIESIDILKDAAAAAIYGSRASNGVVLITTKKGKSGKTQFTANIFTGYSKPTRLRQWLNTAQYVELFNEARANSAALGYGGIPSQTSLNNRFTRYAAGDTLGWKNSRIDTDWQGQAFQDAPMTQADLNATGGDAKTRFFVSLQYLNQKGILVKNSLERLSTRINLDHSATDRLTLGVNLNVVRTANGRLSNDNAFSTPMQIVALPPMTPVIDPRTGQLSGNYTLYYNPLLNRDFASYNTTVYRVLGNVFAEYKIATGLKFRTEWGADLLTQNEDQYYGRETARNVSTPNGLGVQTWDQVTNYTINNYFTYGKTINTIHDFDATLGTSYQQSQARFNSVEGQQFPSNAYRQVNSAARISGGSSGISDFSFLSYFARVNYRYNNRYMLGLVGRIDGSSRFGTNKRYGVFPSASLGWILTEESFMKAIPAISTLKIRASYGLTGNAEVGNFAARGLYSATSAGVSSGYAGVPGQAPAQLANPDLSWEHTLQTDIGLEYGLLSNRLTGEIDYYIKNTSDLLLNVNVPGSSGFRTQLRNVGQLRNQGIEFVLNSQNVTGKFTWTTSLNAARNMNRITNLNGQIIESGVGNVNRAAEGQSIGVFYIREYAGVDPKNGDALYYLNTANTDGSLNRSTTNDYNAAERVYLGNPNPTWIGGVNNTFSYGGVELNFLFQGQFGASVYNGGGKFQSANGDFFDNQTVDQLNRWRKAGDITNVPQARLYGANGTGESSRYLQGADFVRLKTVRLSYTIPSSITNRLKMNRLSVYVSGQNVLTFTKYTGWDPEVNSDYIAGNVALGNDFYSAPQPKTFVAGINIGF